MQISGSEGKNMQMKKHNTMSKPAESQGSLAGGRWGGAQRERNTDREGGHSQGGRDTDRGRRSRRSIHMTPTFPLFTLDQVNAFSSSPAFSPLCPPKSTNFLP